jgi:leader peptidase (prepilin peptidase)/N-methyltransferase
MTTSHSGTQVPAGLAAAALATVAFASYPIGGQAVVAAFVAAVLVVIAVIDIRTLRVPNRIVLPATAIVLVTEIALDPSRAGERVLATLVAGGLLLILNLISSAGLGMGDVKLGMLLGAALGWGVIGALEIAFMALLPFAIAVLLRDGRRARKTALPFAPFMAFGALVVLIVPHLAGLGG